MAQSAAQKEKARAYRKERSAHYAKLNRDWIIANRDKYNASKARYRLKLKREVMGMYAVPVACVRCGFNQIDGLVLDHIEDNGAQHRRECGISSRGGSVSGTRIYEHIRKNGKVAGLQVLCANCNTIKQLRNGRRKSIKDPEILAGIEAEYVSH